MRWLLLPAAVALVALGGTLALYVWPGPPAEPEAVEGASEPTPALDPERWKAELAAQLREELRSEMRGELAAELTRELTEKLSKELRQDMTQGLQTVLRAELTPLRTAAVALLSPGSARKPAAAPTGGARPAPVRSFATLRGVVRDAAGAPIAGAILSFPGALSRVPAAPKLGATVLAVSDANGVLSARLPTKRDAETKGTLALMARGFAGRSVELSLRPGQDLNFGALTLGPGAVTEGRVLAEDGTPVPGVLVQWRAGAPGAEPNAKALAFEVANAMRTDAEGRFELPGLPLTPGASFLGHVVATPPKSAPGLSAVFDANAPPELRITLPQPEPVTEQAPAPEPEVPGSDVAATPTTQSAGAGPAEDGATRAALTEEAVPPADAAPEPEPRRPIRVRLTSAGVPVAWGTVACARDGGGWPETALGESGVGELPLPRGPFVVVAEAPGFPRASLGPFDPEALADELLLELTPGLAFVGRVRGPEGPVVGARIAVHRTELLPGQVLPSAPLAPGVRPFEILRPCWLGDVDATTDAQGRFAVVLDRAGLHTVAVQTPGLPRVVLGPFEAFETGTAPLDLRLEPGGALEGRVIPPPGEPAAGRVVAVCDGGSVALSTLTDEAGRYRFPSLAPGPWQIRPARPGTPAQFQLKAAGPAIYAEPGWDAEVASRASTTYDVDLSGRRGVRLTGRLTVDGEPAVGADAALLAPGAPGRFDDRGLDSDTTGEDGAFVVAVDRPGSFTLRVSHAGRIVFERVELAFGSEAWELDIETGDLEIRGEPPRHEGEVITYAYLRREVRPGTQVWMQTWLQPLDEGHACAVEGAPTGACELVVYSGGAYWLIAGFLVASDWRAIAEVKIDPRVTAELRLE